MKTHLFSFKRLKMQQALECFWQTPTHMKKKLILSSLLFSVALTGCNPPAQNQNNLPKGYLASNVRMFDPATLGLNPPQPEQEVANFVNKQKISSKDAVSSLNAMETAFRNSYIGYALKPQLTKKSSADIFSRCRKKLEAGPKEITSFEYYDHVMSCMAEFKDSHFDLEMLKSASSITTAIAQTAYLQDGPEEKLFITAVRPNLIGVFEEANKLPSGTFAEKIKPGVEIISIDGKNPKEALSQLLPYISASTPEFARYMAGMALFTRNLFYPKNKDVSVGLKFADGSTEVVQMPWIQVAPQDGSQGSLESRILLQQQGIIRSSDLSPDQSLLARSQKGNLHAPIFSELKNKKTLHTQEGQEVLRMGLSELDNQRVCYMRLNTFMFRRDKAGQYLVFEKNGDAINSRNLMEVIKSFLSNCDAFGVNLIFDLRTNGGGSPDVANEIMSMLSRKDTPNVYQATAHFVRPGNSTIMNDILNSADSSNPNVPTQMYFKSMNAAIEAKRPVGDWVAFTNLQAEREVFNQKIVTLISPLCISACEFLSQQLKKAGRAILIGNATSGTGFGFIATASGETVFRDPLNMFNIRLPNQAFQAVTLDESSPEFVGNQHFKARIVPFAEIPLMENNPVTPNIKVNYTKNDLLEDFVDYKKSISRALSGAAAE